MLCFDLHAVADASGFAQEQVGFEWHGGSSGFCTRSGIGQERMLVAGHEISDMDDTGCAPRLARACSPCGSGILLCARHHLVCAGPQTHVPATRFWTGTCR